MGALHQGHMSLIHKSLEENDRSVVSLFVNPIQFNNPEDLAKYPRTLPEDLKVIEAAGGDAVFIPDAAEMYPVPEKGHWDFTTLSHRLEGHFRPGHFDGVLTVVKKFFEIIEPDRAYFGEKDFQQLSLVQRMVAHEKLNVEIRTCPSVREEDGLALSSRNRRLGAVERKAASHIYRVLSWMKENRPHHAPRELEQLATAQLAEVNGLRIEYLSISDAETFEEVTAWSSSAHPIALVAVYAGDVRLIDNLRL